MGSLSAPRAKAFSVGLCPTLRQAAAPLHARRGWGGILPHHQVSELANQAHAKHAKREAAAGLNAAIRRHQAQVVEQIGMRR